MTVYLSTAVRRCRLRRFVAAGVMVGTGEGIVTIETRCPGR